MSEWQELRESITAFSEEEKNEIAVSADIVASLVAQRGRFGWTQKELSSRTGVTRSSIARLGWKLSVILWIDTLT